MQAEVEEILKYVSDKPNESLVYVNKLYDLVDDPTAREIVVDSMGVISLIKILNEHPNDELGRASEKILEKFWKIDPFVAVQMASAGMFRPLVSLLGSG